ncbi:hypothetical protein JCM10512_4338 [Bacteroides reticulotermitis JCM 10512]|uniref:Uncharacterized protein n=1 Tax=Bacteroides reticulotermitis JCM 10512 TaxID=1445607 RepID=W4UYF8_9BACE|nr:hypothetical protein JCM10512_4338 [Bacteroides reticulotermitis JCM 10512]
MLYYINGFTSRYFLFFKGKGTNSLLYSYCPKNRNRKGIDCCGFSQKAVIVAKLFEAMEKRSKVKNFTHFHIVAQCLFLPA